MTTNIVIETLQDKLNEIVDTQRHYDELRPMFGNKVNDNWDQVRASQIEALQKVIKREQALAADPEQGDCTYTAVDSEHLTERSAIELASGIADALPVDEPAPLVRLTDAEIREIFLANGFTIKDGESDLKPYVFKAARAIEARAQQSTPPVRLTDKEIKTICNIHGINQVGLSIRFANDIMDAMIAKNGGQST